MHLITWLCFIDILVFKVVTSHNCIMGMTDLPDSYVLYILYMNKARGQQAQVLREYISGKSQVLTLQVCNMYHFQNSKNYPRVHFVALPIFITMVNHPVFQWTTYTYYMWSVNQEVAAKLDMVHCECLLH